MALFPLLLLLVAVSSALSARIVGFHAVGGSQYINMRHILEELASRGHEVGSLPFCIYNKSTCRARIEYPLMKPFFVVLK